MTVSGPADPSSSQSFSLPNSKKETAEDKAVVSSIAQNAIADRLAALKAKRKPQTMTPPPVESEVPLPVSEPAAKAAPPPLPSSFGGKGKGKGIPPAPPPPGKGTGKGVIPPPPPFPGGKGVPPPPTMGGPPMAPLMGFATASRMGIFDGLQKMVKAKDPSPESPKKSGESKFTVYLDTRGISYSMKERDEVYVPLMEIVKDIIEYGNDIDKLLSFLKYKFPKKEGETFDSKEKQNFGIELRGYKTGLSSVPQEDLEKILTFSAESLSLSEEESGSFEKLPKAKLEKIQLDALNCLLKAESISSTEYQENFRGMLQHLASVEDPSARAFIIDNFIEEPKGATEKTRKIKLFYADVVSLAEAVSKQESEKKKQEIRKGEFIKSFVDSKSFKNMQDLELDSFIKKITSLIDIAEKGKGKIRDSLYAQSGNFPTIETMTENNVKAIQQWMDLTEKLKKIPKHTQLFSTVLEEQSAVNCLNLPPIGDDTEQNLDNFLALFSADGLFREKGVIVYEIHNQFFKKFWPCLMDQARKNSASLHSVVHSLKAKVESGEVKNYDELVACLKV
ncbi:MAG: hypothetical protein ACI9S8_001526 [Chlamydiales bacterium]|jgi:hypothetical protein